MSVELRLPYITGGTEREQLQQLKSYLYQLTEQLQIALNANDPTSATQQVVIQSTNAPSSSAPQPFDAEVTFAALKPLIIKSAEIVEAYYEEINKKLEGIYVAESDFGIYTQKTSQTITENAEGVDRKFANYQSIVENVKDDLSATNKIVLQVNGNVRTGVLYYENDIPIYGVEVGQNVTVNDQETFKAFARFISNRLSLFDSNGREVAYISDRKLYIRDAEITESSKTGGFKDTISKNGDVITKWEGV